MSVAVLVHITKFYLMFEVCTLNVLFHAYSAYENNFVSSTDCRW